VSDSPLPAHLASPRGAQPGGRTTCLLHRRSWPPPLSVQAPAPAPALERAPRRGPTPGCLTAPGTRRASSVNLVWQQCVPPQRRGQSGGAKPSAFPQHFPLSPHPSTAVPRVVHSSERPCPQQAEMDRCGSGAAMPEHSRARGQHGPARRGAPPCEHPSGAASAARELAERVRAEPMALEAGGGRCRRCRSPARAVRSTTAGWARARPT
jgi:hypothetical protein